MTAVNQDMSHLVCPWCKRNLDSFVVNGTLKLECRVCRMQSFCTRLPSGKRIADFTNRRLIS